MLSVSGAARSLTFSVAIGMLGTAALGAGAAAVDVRRAAEPQPASLTAPVGFVSGVAPNDVVAGDLDDDGDADLVVANKDTGDVSVLVGNGDGTVGEPVPYSVAPGAVQNVALGSLDPEYDADLDLVVMNYDQGQTDDVAVLRGSEGAAFLPPTDYPGDSPDDGFTDAQTTVATGDFNQDGDLDLALGTANFSNLVILLGQPGAAFGAPTEISLSNGTQNMTPVVADFNQDGDPDIAVERAQAVSVLLGGPGASFGPQTDYPVADWPTNIVTDDFDADGDPDLATVTWGIPGTVTVMMGGPGGNFSDPVTFPAGGDYSSDLAPGDVNGDDAVDLVVASGGFTDVGGVTVHLGRGDGTFAEPQPFPANPRPHAVALTDLDGDADLDVVVTNRGGGEFYPDQLSVLENETVPADSTPPDTVIVAGPADHAYVLSEGATIALESTEQGSTFACSLDGAETPCPTGEAVLGGLTHRTHIFEGAATDPSGNADPEPARRSWTVPLDDSQLSADRHWTRKQASGPYLAGFSQSSRKGATLSKKVSGARALALVVTKAPGYGRVAVYAGKRRLATVSLAAASRRANRLVRVATLDALFTGAVRVVVTTSGKTVRIQGLGVAT